MILTVLVFFVGVGLLYVGAEGLVRGSIAIAQGLRIRPIVIGLTVVAFGTSAPEFIVSLISAFAGSSDIALGNVVGSNIANIGLILGIAALIYPVDIESQSITIYYPVLLLSSIILYLFALNEIIGFVDGLFLMGGIVVFTIFLIKRTEKVYHDDSTTVTKEPVRGLQVLFVIAGIVFLVIGSHLMVESGVTIARSFGISEFIIGATLIAVGTSLPELAATIVAVMKKNTCIIIGNIIGSNIFNVLFVAGGVSLLHPLSVDTASLRFEFPVMIAFSVVLLIMMKTGFLINRIEGILLLLGYIVFLAFLF